MVAEAGAAFQIQDERSQFIGTDAVDRDWKPGVSEELPQQSYAPDNCFDCLGRFSFGIRVDAVTVKKA
jgi:hypothetical protein